MQLEVQVFQDSVNVLLCPVYRGKALVFSLASDSEPA